MRNLEIALILGLTGLQQTAFPQRPVQPAPETYVVRVDVNMIVLHPTVQDRNGAFVSGLTKDAFTLTEDGVRQQVTLFSSEDVPVAAGLVIDNSGSMGGRRVEVITGALMFIRGCRPNDEIFVVNFNDVAELGLPPDRSFSNDVTELRTALMKGVVGGPTALYDGIALALDHFEKTSLMKKVLLIVSDGADNQSLNGLDRIIERADRAGVLMYTIGLFDGNADDKNPGVLKRLARQSGGLAYLPKDISQVTAVCSQIAKDIRSQYTVGYASRKASANSDFHRLKLTAVDRSGRQLQVRSRSGFFGVKPASTKETKPHLHPSPQ